MDKDFSEKEKKQKIAILTIVAYSAIFSIVSLNPYSIGERYADAQPTQSVVYCFTTQYSGSPQGTHTQVCSPTEAGCEQARASGAFGDAKSPCHQQVRTVPPGGGYITHP